MTRDAGLEAECGSRAMASASLRPDLLAIGATTSIVPDLFSSALCPTPASAYICGKTVSSADSPSGKCLAALET